MSSRQFKLELPRVLDNTVLSTYQECPRRFYYQYGLGRIPVGGTENWPVQFGVAYHVYRHILQINGGNHDAALEAALTTFGSEDPPVDHSKSFLTRERLKKSCELAFTAVTGEKRRGLLKVIASEQPFEVALPSGAKIGGIIDQAVEWQGRLWARDFKTTSYQGKTYEEHFNPNQQVSIYTYALSVLSGGEPVAGTIIETLYNTMKQGPTIKQFPIERSKGNIEQTLQAVEYTIERIKDSVEHEDWPQLGAGNGACHTFSGCPYRGACNMSSWPMTDRWLAGNTEERRWDFSLDRGAVASE